MCKKAPARIINYVHIFPLRCFIAHVLTAAHCVVQSDPNDDELLTRLARPSREVRVAVGYNDARATTTSQRVCDRIQTE